MTSGSTTEVRNRGLPAPRRPTTADEFPTARCSLVLIDPIVLPPNQSRRRTDPLTRDKVTRQLLSRLLPPHYHLVMGRFLSTLLPPHYRLAMWEFLSITFRITVW